MRLRKFFLRVLLGSIVIGAFMAKPLIAETTLIDLDRVEPYDSMVFTGGYLFVGKTRTEENGQHLVIVFDRNDQIVKSIVMPHTVEHIYAHGTNEVLVIGTAASPNRRHYSIIKIANGQFELKDHTIAINAWGNDWLGTYGDKEYFTDFGGNTDDPQGDANPNLPSQTIFTMDKANRTKFLPVRMRSPIHGIIVDHEIFVARFYQLGDLRRNIYKLNILTGEFEDLFSAPRDHLSDMIAIDNNLLAVAEAGANRVLFVDRTSKQIMSEVTVEGYPRSMQKVGSCIAVGAERDRQVKLVSIKNSLAPTVVGAIDFSLTNFGGLRKLTVDELSGRIYGRSAYVCNNDGCRKHWNSVAVSTAADADLVKAQCL